MPRNKLTGKALEGAVRNGLIAGSTTPPPNPGTHAYAQLSLPPSTNNLFMNAKGRGRVKSKQYREWIEDNGHAAGSLKTPDRFPVRVCLKVGGKLNVRRDLDNLIKPCLDLLVSVGVLPDDSWKYVTGGRWEYQPGECDPFVLVWWEEVV